MGSYKFDVVIIGAGPAGIAAAGALAGAGIPVAVLEAGVYAGAENWSGCVYFTESLAAEDCFGPQAVAASPFERRVVRRGTLMHNGLDLVGLELNSDPAFRGCYTVLRPLFDPYFANLAQARGAVLLPGTTVTSLIRNNGKVIGVETNRGSLLAGVTFIAEGDASHLVRAERLERVEQPHFLQGVKGVLSLPRQEIEKRFGLGAEEGAAYELLLRNPAMAGRTALLNAGGFLYTNRDSISIGYVAPLDRIRDNFRGSHDALYEWMCGLPWISELIRGSRLSAYGTRIIRSGGWHERPVLVEDGLAVGGAAAGLGVDIPFPNFTGPASATGLYFARAVRNILKQSHSFDAKHLTAEYLTPLFDSVYGKNARHLSRWPAYFGGSRALFGSTVDLSCGTAHFLSAGSITDTARFLRGHILSIRRIRELSRDTARAIDSLGLWKPLVKTIVSPATVWKWIANSFRKSKPPDARLGIVVRIGATPVDPRAFPWPFNSFLRRLAPALLEALEQVYANDRRPAAEKFSNAVRLVLGGLNLADLVVLPAWMAALALAAVGTAVIDAFRFYALKTPVDTLLAEPVMAYQAAQKKARDLDLVRPSTSLEAKLATNTYRVGSRSHIRTVWPDPIASQPDMARTGLWWVCPARVYAYDPPALAGRGRITVNYENCIKCESCWRAEPARTLWGRHTDHKLIYRPESAAADLLLESLSRNTHGPAAGKPAVFEETVSDLRHDARRCVEAAANASWAFRQSMAALPSSADWARRSWPVRLGNRLSEKLARLEAALTDSGRQDLAHTVRSERNDLEQRLNEGRLFHALYCSMRIEERIRAWTGRKRKILREEAGPERIAHREVSLLFPDQTVKQWEEAPMPEPWGEKLRAFVRDHADAPAAAIRALSSVNPALGLIAAHQFAAARILSKAGLPPEPAVIAVDGSDLHILDEANGGVRIKGSLQLIPVAAAHKLLICSGSRGYRVALSSSGVTVTATPAIGFRAAGLSDIAFDCVAEERAVDLAEGAPLPDACSYLSIALGAADYLSRRVKDHAAGRIQFQGQMLDTEGRDGIAKMGAVKALIARIEAWKLLLERLYGIATRPGRPDVPALDLLSAVLAAKAFGPEPGTLGYDAGQVFGGFAYSEDDLLSRFYRDSSLFRFLVPGFGAAATLGREPGNLTAGTALQPFADLSVVEGAPFGPIVSRLELLDEKCGRLPAGADTALSGEAKAIVTGTRLLLVSLERELNGGQSNEAGFAAIEVLLGLAEDALMKAILSAGRGSVAPSAVFPVEPPSAWTAMGTDYQAFCRAPGMPHRSGSFLMTVFDRSSRFVPEMQLDDEKLRKRWADLVAWFRENCSERQFEGLSIERFIEARHRLPADIVEAARKNKWLATYIPQSLDGLGWHKAEYYILNSAAGSFGDASIDLLIMASTSIGTTPILLGLEEELPRVREELAPLAHDEQKLGEIGIRVGKIISSLASPNPAWIRKEYEAVMKLVDDRIRRTRVVKYLAANFLKTFYAAGIAGSRGDFGGFTSQLKHAGKLFGKIMPDIRSALEELPRRERCHQLFLRYLGHGAVSAFALTEPTAGSDSGGVKTTAKLLRAQLTDVGDGRYSFEPAGPERSIRYLIDANRIVCTGNGVAYETPDGQRQTIRNDRYDYATDRGHCYYTYKGEERAFHDIGQVRQTSSGLFYEYYSLTGAKMWITNGSIATQFCLYAQTPEGVTGFMVDRHSEGLKVGADEKKMGQRGSPTNEISIDNVRVAREAVIGYEGHGQVNALETLNVGRCGLAVVSGALMRKMMGEANAVAPRSPERDRLLGEAAAVLFGSESLAYYLVGLFDRPHESVRMESAIAKYVCSEDIHELITLVEQAFGPEGQTGKFLVEKARRDSRILTIYEGTNEIQRFLILKDLIADAENWPELPETREKDADRALASWKNRLRGYVKQARKLLGDASWSDAMLQPALFPLAEMAGEILRLECIQYRLEWLNAAPSVLDRNLPAYRDEMLGAGRRAADRTVARLGRLEEKFQAAVKYVGNNLDMPEVVLADSALDALSQKEAPYLPAPLPLSGPHRVLAIVRPVADLSPRPRLQQETLRELVWRMNSSDLAALALLPDTRENGSIVVDVLMPGSAEHELLLRMTAGTRAGRLYRIDTDPSVEPFVCLQAIKDLENERAYDLIVTGTDCPNGDQWLGAYVAGGLGRSHESMDVKPGGTASADAALPGVLSIRGSVRSPELPLSESVAGFSLPVRVLKTAGNPAPAFAVPSGAPSGAPVSTTPSEAASFIRAFAASASAGAVPDFTGDLSRSDLSGSDAVWALLEPHDQKGNPAVLRACAATAGLSGMTAQCVIPAPREMWPQLLGIAKANGCIRAFCVETGAGKLSDEGRQALLQLLLQTSGRTAVLAGTQWSSPFARTAGIAAAGGRTVLFAAGATGISREGPGRLVFSLPAYGGKLLRRRVLETEAALVTIGEDADIAFPPAEGVFQACVPDLAVDRRHIVPLPPLAPPTLTQADVIIDLGYGIRDESGLKLARELREKLESLGLAPLFGATRKVTQDLKLLPLEAQIGQTGVRVNPKLVIALGISGAPQHIDYIGTRAEILCFNKDNDAPLMQLSRSQLAPRVHPILGDLFTTVRELIAQL